MCADSNVVLGASAPGAARASSAERHRRAARRSAAHDRAVDDVELVGAGLHQLGGGMQDACARSFVAASRVASPLITVTREAKAPMPSSMRSVWP